MNDKELIWETLSREPILHTPVFDVLRQRERAANGMEGDYVAMEAPDWVMVIPEWEDSFLLVKQWRHALEALTLEFPGGVRDGEEDPAETAARELLEETGCQAGELIHLGTCSPNPALFKNRFHCYLARDLRPTGRQHLDPDELLTCQPVPKAEVLENFGSPLYAHGLMGTALAFYLGRRA